nr:sodium/hydrogen exchanger 10 isoform X8 [Oryctolagus cuniculus]
MSTDNAISFNSNPNNRRNTGSWLELFRVLFLNNAEDLPEIILILSLICTIGAFLNLHLKDFPIPLPVILFLLGCSFEILSFTSFQIQSYADAIQWMSPDLFFGIFTPVIIFNVAFDMDVYMLQKLLWQILLITIPGFAINYILILWYLQTVNKLFLKTIPWFLFATILVSSDPMLTAAAIRDLGLSRGLTNLINGESLMTSVISLIIFNSVVNTNFRRQHKTNSTLGSQVMYGIWSYFIASFLFGILSSKLIQLWMSTVFGDDVNYISLIFSLLYLIFYICELVGMSGIFTLTIMGLFLNSTSFKPGVEVLLLEFWNCLSFVAFLMVFSFTGLLIPAHTYLYISFSDIYYSINIYFTLIVLRLLVFLLMSPLLSRLGHGFSWRWAFIMVWSEMKGMPNINMALLLAYSDLSLGSEREKYQVLFHGVLVCLITLIVNRFILPMAVNKLGLRDVTSTKYKSVYYTFQHFQELTKSTASALKFDRDLANADWNVVEKAIVLRNPYALEHEEETLEHQKVRCPSCDKEIDETLNLEAMELANRRLLSAQIASYQRQYRNEILSQSAVQVLVGAAGSFGEKKGEYMNLGTIKVYSESKKFLTFLRKLLLNWVYNTKKDKGVPSRHLLFRVCHKAVFTDEFEYVGYLVILMNVFPIIISWIPQLNKIYDDEIKYTNYSFLAIYILEALLKIAAMRRAYFSHAWNIFELAITFIGIIDVILIETSAINYSFDLIQTVVIMKIARFLRLLRILKLIMAKTREVLDFQSIIKPMTVEETLYHIPWLDKDENFINFIQERAKIVTFDCGNNIFEEGDEPKGIYIIISGMVKLKRSKPGLGIDQMESEDKDYQIIYTDYVLSGEIIGELNCLTNEQMKYSAICKTVVETCFISKTHLIEAFEQCCPIIEHKMWLKIGLGITARKIREHLSYEDWNYKMQLKLCNIYVRDIPKSIKSDIYDETVTDVILIHGAVEDCQLRKVYKAPFLIPLTCHQIQGTEDFTKVMMIQTSIDMKKFRFNSRKYVSTRKISSVPKSLGVMDKFVEKTEAHPGAAVIKGLPWLSHNLFHGEEATSRQTCADVPGATQEGSLDHGTSQFKYIFSQNFLS